MTKPQRALVLGMGRSGRAAATLLLRDGANVSVYDRDAARLDGRLGPEVTELSGPALPSFDGFDRIVASPGLRLEAHPRLLPEVELAAEHFDAPLIGVTGTNGKSTTVVLIGEMLRASGLRVPVGGNLGTPLIEPPHWS